MIAVKISMLALAAPDPGGSGPPSSGNHSSRSVLLDAQSAPAASVAFAADGVDQGNLNMLLNTSIITTAADKTQVIYKEYIHKEINFFDIAAI